MDRSNVKQLVENCKSNSSSKVIESLSVIRYSIIRSSQGIAALKECGGIEMLVSLLKKQKENVMELALSTLGNCCMDEQISLDVGKLKGLHQVVVIIKALNKDKLIGRACRLLGNLAQQKSNAEQLIEEDVTSALVSIISNTDKTSSAQTLEMGVRALRLLWMNSDRQDDMLSCGAVRAVAVLLCAECEAAGLLGEDGPRRTHRDKDREQLMKGLLKCLGYFTATANHKCAEQILGEGAGYRCLVVLCKDYEEMASKCLVNLCYVGPSRPILGTAGAVECLVNLIKSHSGRYPECYLNTVCLLCREAVNRAKLRQCGGLEVLLEAVKDTSQLSTHTTALRALLQFVFDDLSFQMLISQGLIGIIEDQMKEYVRGMKCEHQVQCEGGGEEEENCKIVIESDNMMVGFNDTYSISEEDSDAESATTPPHGRKRSRRSSHSKSDSLQKMTKYDCWSGISREPAMNSSFFMPNMSPLSGYSPMSCSSRSPDARNFATHVYARSLTKSDEEKTPDCLSNENVPSVQLSGGQWSPGSPSSLCYSSPLDEDLSDSEQSERYSPVCSDVEEDREEEKAEGLAASEMDELMIDDETLSIKELQMEDSSSHQSKSHRMRCLLVLLSRASHTDSGIENLASPTLLLALLSYIQNSRNPANRAARVLARIISYATHIIRILKHRLILHLYKLLHEPRHQECKQCSQLKKVSSRLMTQLTMLAESDYGIGEISYHLQKGEPHVKQSLALTLPYIVRSQRPLKKFLIDCKAFDLLFNTISCGKEPLEHSVPSLAQLARSLHIKNPKMLEQSFKSVNKPEYVFDGGLLEPDHIVCLVLDDGSRVHADKHFLCRHSDVFNAMFTGAFRESSESNVQLKNVSKDSLEYLLVLLHSGFNSKESSTDTFPLPVSLHTLLETLLLTDKFLMEQLKSQLYSAIVQFKLEWDTASEIYMWSLTEGVGLLCVEATAYILTGDMSHAHRLQAVCSIMNTRYKHQFVDDIKGILIRHLK